MPYSTLKQVRDGGLLCFLTERQSQSGRTYFVANGFGATKLDEGAGETHDPNGRHVISRDDIADIAPDNKKKYSRGG